MFSSVTCGLSPNVRPIITSLSGRRAAKRCDDVHSHISKTTRPNFTKFFVRTANCLWPWLDVPVTALRYVMYFRLRGRRHVFTQWALYMHRICIPKRRERNSGNCYIDYNQILLNDEVQQVQIAGCSPRVESAIKQSNVRGSEINICWPNMGAKFQI